MSISLRILAVVTLVLLVGALPHLGPAKPAAEQDTGPASVLAPILFTPSAEAMPEWPESEGCRDACWCSCIGTPDCVGPPAPGHYACMEDCIDNECSPFEHY